MSYSHTVASTVAFTRTHARHMVAKVATDLKRMQRFYGEPSDSWIAWYEEEVIEFLKEGYLDTVMYGFHLNGNWVEPTLFYTARDLAGSFANDDDPGRIRPGRDITGATFYSYLTYSWTWRLLNATGQEEFIRRLPFQRTGALQPGVAGYLRKDLTYSSGGRALDRAIVRSWR